MDTTPFPNQADDAVTEPSYERDVVAWANEQARRLRAGEFHRLDIEHIADEIEDVGRSEKRELASRISVLMAHLLKWQYQPGRRGASWTGTIRVQRRQMPGGSWMRSQASKPFFEIRSGNNPYGTMRWRQPIVKLAWKTFPTAAPGTGRARFCRTTGCRPSVRPPSRPAA